MFRPRRGCRTCEEDRRGLQVVDVRLTSQSATITDLDHRISQIDTAVEEATRRGRTAAAMNLAERQRAVRDGLNSQRQAATATLIEMQTQRAALTAETARVEAAAGPVQYLATIAGTDSETAVRWLILLMVFCCDPAAIALTIAVAGEGKIQFKHVLECMLCRPDWESSTLQSLVKFFPTGRVLDCELLDLAYRALTGWLRLIDWLLHPKHVLG